MRARSTRFAGSVRDREISTNARRWSASTDNAIIRRAATMAPPAMPQRFIPHIAQIGYLDTTYRTWNLSTRLNLQRRNAMYIDHVGINTNDMEATLQFYCGILGMRLVRTTRTPDGRRHYNV